MIVVDILLSVVILILIGYHAWYVKETNARLNEFMRALISKNIGDYKYSEKKMDTMNEEPQETQFEFVPASELTSEEFEKVISSELGNE